MNAVPRAVSRVLEVQPGEGGDDAAAFARTLAGVLTARAERLGMTVSRPPDLSRVVRVVVTGTPDAARGLEDLAGVHRVQRVSAGRRHTSTVTVTFLDAGTAAPAGRRFPPAVDVSDVEVTRYRGHGKGGQHRNKVSTAVRVVHRPSGTTVVRERGRSQSSNLADALADLGDRLAGADAAKAAERVRAVKHDQAGAVLGRTGATWQHTEYADRVTHLPSGRSWSQRRWRRGVWD